MAGLDNVCHHISKQGQNKGKTSSVIPSYLSSLVRGLEKRGFRVDMATPFRERVGKEAGGFQPEKRRRGWTCPLASTARPESHHEPHSPYCTMTGCRACLHGPQGQCQRCADAAHVSPFLRSSITTSSISHQHAHHNHSPPGEAWPPLQPRTTGGPPWPADARGAAPAGQSLTASRKAASAPAWLA